MRLAAFAIVAVGAAGLATYDQRVIFQRVDARFSAINEQCYMEKVTREGITKTTSTFDLLRCELEYAGLPVLRVTAPAGARGA